MLHRPGKRAQQVTFGVFVALLFALFGAEIAVDYSPVKLTILFCALFWVPLLVVHELGHAVVARAFGCRVTLISLGYGSTLWLFSIGGAVVDVRSIPVEGFVQFVPGDRPLGRIRNALVYFAGPGTELAIAGLILAIVGPDVLLSRSDHIGVMALQSLCACIAMSATINLIPHTANTSLDAIAEGRRPTPNDGLGIVKSLFGSRSSRS